jgi:hypothetical protein
MLACISALSSNSLFSPSSAKDRPSSVLGQGPESYQGAEKTLLFNIFNYLICDFGFGKVPEIRCAALSGRPHGDVKDRHRRSLCWLVSKVRSMF